jgi:hypothetical protein
MSTDFITLHCPYCGESFETAIDASAGDDQQYVEDCAICCKPINVRVAMAAGGEVMIRTLRDDDSG